MQRKITAWMQREVNKNLASYLDESDCFDMTTMAERCYAHFVPSNAGEEIPDLYWDSAFTVHERLDNKGLINT